MSNVMRPAGAGTGADSGTGVIPSFTIGDRLRKAREQTGMTTRDFAAALGVSQSTITNAENERSKTRRITLLMWSNVTGVPVEWLETGECPDAP